MVAADTPGRPEGADEAEVGRRAVLRGISAMGLAVFAAAPLAACGDDDEPAAVANNTPEATPEATAATPKATPKPKKTAGAEPKATATAKAEATPKATPKAAEQKLVKASDTPLASTTDIPVNSGMLFEFDEYIVTQPKSGDFRGFDSICTHEGCPVDVFDTPGEMDCSCHDSHFKITDGTVISGPAKKPLPRKPIIVEGGKIYKAKPA